MTKLERILADFDDALAAAQEATEAAKKGRVLSAEEAALHARVLKADRLLQTLSKQAEEAAPERQQRIARQMIHVARQALLVTEQPVLDGGSFA